MDEELDICFFSQQEDLARTLVRKKLQTRHRLKLAEERLASTRQNCSAMELKLDEQRTQLESLRQKIELLQEEPDIHSTDIQVQLHEAPIGDAEVEIAFLKEKQKRSQS
jgi:phage shock protein A